MAQPVFKINATEALGKFAALGQALRNKTPLLRIFGNLMVRSSNQTFREGGSPAGSWRQLRAGSVRAQYAGRRRRKIGALTKRQQQAGYGKTAAGGDTAAFTRFAGAKKILITSGMLMRSVTFAVDSGGGAVNIGSNLKYARIHQLGGVITPKNRRFLRFPIGGGNFVFAKKVVMPARPFLKPRPEDPERLIRTGWEYLAEQFKAGGQAGVPGMGAGGPAPEGEW
jgi:phage gpG-like protein